MKTEEILAILRKDVTPAIKELLINRDDVKAQRKNLDKALSKHRIQDEVLEADITRLIIKAADVMSEGGDFFVIQKSILEKKEERRDVGEWLLKLRNELIPASQKRLMQAEQELMQGVAEAIKPVLDVAKESVSKEIEAAMDSLDAYTKALNVFCGELEMPKSAGMATEFPKVSSERLNDYITKVLGR